MKTELSIGQWRGLKTTSTASNTFAILAFDQRGSYRRMLPENTAFETASRIKREVVEAISPHASAVLLDPIYGLEAATAMAGTSGLLVAVEKTGYSGEATARRVDFIDGWSVAKIKQMGASAVKILVYYHPHAGEATEHVEDIVRQVSAQCRQYDLPFFVEPVTYSPDPNIPKNSQEFSENRPKIIRETVERLQDCGADVLKIEFPVDASFDNDTESWRKACEAISDIAKVPWALLSAGVDFEVFEKQVRVACEAGSSGFLGGRAIWKESIAMNETEREQFLSTVAVKRMQTLRDIVETYGRAWTDYYQSMPVRDGWFQSYMTNDEA